MDVTISVSKDMQLRELLAVACEGYGSHGIARDLRADNVTGGWPLIAMKAIREAYKYGVSEAY